MSTSVFPTGSLKGITFSSVKTPTWARRIQRSVSGREIVVQDYANPIWNFRLTFGFLRDYPVGLVLSELRLLMDFYLQMQASGDTFLYRDRDDYFVTDEPIGIGDGVTTSFQLVRHLVAGGFPEDIIAPESIVNVKLNGVITPNWAVDPSTGIITFAGAPIVSQLITATFFYHFRCRFVDDAIDFERFMHQLWTVKELRFRSVVL
jgi:uncharacterized protein (TIGR02217 family)